MGEEEKKGKIKTFTGYMQYMARGNYMERSFKKIWIARFLALLITSVALAIIIYGPVKKKGYYDYIIEVSANDAEPIVKAVENLEISEIYIKTTKAMVANRNHNIFEVTIEVFFFLGLFLGVYYSIYCAINNFLFSPKKDKSILTQT